MRRLVSVPNAERDTSAMLLRLESLKYGTPEYEKAKREYDTALERNRGSNFTGGHFPEPNVLFHVRTNDRTDAEGRRTLFLEEVQTEVLPWWLK